jgi:zinc transporter ZupT
MIALVVGFLLFHSLEKFLLVHHSHEADYAVHHHPQVGVLSALALIGHSFMDGVGIGLAFQVSQAAGIVVAMAVIAHDFSDGLNTVSLMLVHHNTSLRSFRMLLLDALAPILGAASTLAFRVPPNMLMLYLGFFAGFLLYIGAADILPEAHSRSRPSTTGALIGMTCLGAAFIFVAVRLLG